MQSPSRRCDIFFSSSRELPIIAFDFEDALSFEVRLDRYCHTPWCVREIFFANSREQQPDFDVAFAHASGPDRGRTNCLPGPMAMRFGRWCYWLDRWDSDRIRGRSPGACLRREICVPARAGIQSLLSQASRAHGENAAKKNIFASASTVWLRCNSRRARTPGHRINRKKCRVL